MKRYDIPNANSPKWDQFDKATIKFIFQQFTYKYSDFYIKRSLKNQEEVTIDPSLRTNISILLIVGSSFQIQKSKFFEGKYQKNAEDLDTALLIRHLFHYVFGIPLTQILITSTQNNDFSSKGINDLISTPNPIFNGINDIKPELERHKSKAGNPIDENNEKISNEKNDYKQDQSYYFDISNKDEFLLFQDINLAQVGTKQYKFYLNEDLEKIIKPFNIHVIDQELTTSDNTHLLVFIIDHEYTGGFTEISYQFLIERLLQIKCKHFYVFNDSCFSGSMINLIKICESFQKIFPGIQNHTVESALFYFLTNLNKVDASLIGEAIQNKIDAIDSYDINNECKKDVKSKLLEINSELYSDISKFVLVLDKFTSIGCVPNHFIQFSQKSTIFTSSAFDQISLTLPCRKCKISILNKYRIRVFGTVFTSIIIESFLHNKAILSLDNFCNHIRDRLRYYKNQFINLTEIQNQQIDKKTVNTSLPNKDQIISFFNADFTDKFHFYNYGNEWPDLSSIILKEKYWNVDISDVNINEYKGVYFCMFRKHISQTLIENPNKYGPIKGSYYMDKFMDDFENEVNLLFEKNGIQIVFKVNNSRFIDNPKLRDELLSKCCLDYDKFIGLLRPVINSANFQAILLLKAPLSLFFDENPSYIDQAVTIFADSFKKVIPFWKDYDL